MINTNKINITYDLGVDLTYAEAAQYGDEPKFELLDDEYDSNLTRCDAFPINIITKNGTEILHLNLKEKNRLYQKLRDVSKKNNKTMFVAESLLHRNSYGLPTAMLATGLLMQNPIDNISFPVHNPKEIIINAKDPKRIEFKYFFAIPATQIISSVGPDLKSGTKVDKTKTEKVIDTIFYEFGYVYTGKKIEPLKDSIRTQTQVNKAIQFAKILANF